MPWHPIQLDRGRLSKVRHRSEVIPHVVLPYLRLLLMWYMTSSEIYQIPQDLRTVLEACLSEDPSPHALNKYLPRVRQIIATLLRGLQSKQAAYWHAVEDSPIRR